MLDRIAEAFDEFCEEACNRECNGKLMDEIKMYVEESPVEFILFETYGYRAIADEKFDPNVIDPNDFRPVGLCKVKGLKEFKDGLAMLIARLANVETRFFRYMVFESGNPNFLITSYYHFYLAYLEAVYNNLKKLAEAGAEGKERVVEYMADAVLIFGLPLMMFAKERKFYFETSMLAGMLLDVVSLGTRYVPSTDSWGHYLFEKLHSDKEE